MLGESHNEDQYKEQGFCSTLAQIFFTFKVESQESLLERYFSKKKKVKTEVPNTRVTALFGNNSDI